MSGKWAVQRCDGDSRYDVTDDNGWIAVEIETEADALLIAAAPELLAACDAAAKTMRKAAIEVSTEAHEALIEEAARVEAAIKLAKGET